MHITPVESNNNQGIDIDKDFRYAFSFYMSDIRSFCESVQCHGYLEINDKEIDVIVKILRGCSDMAKSIFKKDYFLGEF